MGWRSVDGSEFPADSGYCGKLGDEAFGMQAFITVITNQQFLLSSSQLP